MADKVTPLGLERDSAYLYFVRRGDVWRVRRPAPELSLAQRQPERVAEGGATPDSAYLYFLDRDGDLARVKRQLKTPRRRKKRSH